MGRKSKKKRKQKSVHQAKKPRPLSPPPGVAVDAFFRQATLRVCGTLDIEKAMSRCLKYLKRFLPADQLFMVLHEPGLGALRVIAEADEGSGVQVDRVEPLSAEAREAVRRIREDPPEVWTINRPTQDVIARDISIVRTQSPLSFLVLPLIIEGEILGLAILATPQWDQYTHEHAGLFALLREPFGVALSNALRHREVLQLKDTLAEDNRYLRQELRRLHGDAMVGANGGLREVMRLVAQVAPLDSPVLITGETGVGKDVIANAIHSSSPRREGPFIKVNCGAMPESLLDSELFGHERGAFTGAINRKRGHFERAHGGTIFLDEVGDLHPQAQVRMLRVLQFREIERIGAATPTEVDIRVIAATHRDMEEMVGQGTLRQDLFFRLNVFPIHIPPLRERMEDLPALVHHFTSRKARELKLPQSPQVDPAAMERLSAYRWPGNVRELENVVERALILQREGPLSFDGFNPEPHLFRSPSEPEIERGERAKARDPLQAEERRGSEPLGGKRAGWPSCSGGWGLGRPPSLKLDDISAAHIERVLALTNGKINGPSGAAKILGLHPNTLRHRMKKLGLWDRLRHPHELSGSHGRESE